MSLLIRDARVLCMGAQRPAAGKALGDLHIHPRADVLVEAGVIRAVEPVEGESPRLAPHADTRVIDGAGRVLMPGFVDCHTHACFAGDRLHEWEMKLAGKSYMDILHAGGGIMSTVRAVRAASQHELEESLRARLELFLRQGTTTVEVKSGYGLTTEHELTMLRAIVGAARGWPGTVVPTAMLGHVIDPERPHFVDEVIAETLPAVHAEFPGIAVDAFCEQGAWTLAQCLKLFEKARALGHPIRVHADQFTSMGMVHEAARIHAISVDHLESTTALDATILAASTTIGVGLPVCNLHLTTTHTNPMTHRYANLRAIVDHQGRVAIATNFNPGSAPCYSMPLAMGGAVRFCGLTPHEAITAATLNASGVLGLADRGNIAPGQRADLVLLRHHDERNLAFELGGEHVAMVIAGGQVVHDP